MAISEALAEILAARYGRDVRQAIHDAIEENYEDVSAARTLADSATIAANDAASLANTKAGLADEKASLANTKAGLADSAATAANDAASLANTKAGLADEATTAANNAASLANTKAGLADDAAQDATDAAAYANAITQKYIHIRYSAINPDSDDDMTSTPSDWIGIYSGTSASAPTAYTSYAWFKYKGETGDLSIYGVGNADGNIPLNNGVVNVNLNADKLDGLDSTDFAAVSHPHVKSDITDFPTSMPASDVSAWAKAETKPAYTPSEVGAAPAVHNQSADTITTGILDVERGGTGVSTSKDIALFSYPIGAVYMSIDATSPATLFGGTWSALPTGRFLRVGTGGTTGGSDTHVHSTGNMALTLAQIPEHRHGVLWKFNLGGASGSGYYAESVAWEHQSIWTDYQGSGAVHGHGDTGSASNVPAYYEVYAWRRTA